MVREQADRDHAPGRHGGSGHSQATGTQMETTALPCSTKDNIYVAAKETNSSQQSLHCYSEFRPSTLMATRSFLALTFQEPWQKSTSPTGKAEPATRVHKDGKPA